MSDVLKIAITWQGKNAKTNYLNANNKKLEQVLENV
jgi:hypothetical protein